MGSQAAEQIIAGVVLSERLAVTMYGAIHRAQWSGQRNLRGLIVDDKMLAEDSFRIALTGQKGIETAIALEHKLIVPTVAVESGGAEVVVVTRGVGRYVTVQDLIESARSHNKKLPLEVAAAIGKAVVEALAVAHKANVVHGAVHPRSVLIDETGDVRLGDFVVGRALTSAVAQGADSSLWRGLSGYIAPELVVGEDPTPGADVYAVGAMLFTMLSGELPPGSLHVTPAVERLVQRALDTDVSRRYRSASDLLENLQEAFEDDRWEIAERGEIIRTAGLSSTDSNVDEATEDLLASLGSTQSGKMQVTAPIRPSVDLRAETSGANRKSIDALLQDLDDNTGMTKVDDLPFKRDPISEIIQRDPRKKEAIVQAKPRVPSLDDPDDETPVPPKRPPSEARARSNDEAAALDALASLDEPVRRVSTAAEQATNAADRLERAAQRAEAAADKAESRPAIRPPVETKRPVARPNVEPIVIEDLPVANVKSPMRYVVFVLLVGAMGFGAYMAYQQYTKQGEQMTADEERRIKEQKEKEELEAQLRSELPDPGAVHINADQKGGVWLKIGRTPVDTMPLKSSIQHEFRLEGVAGFDPIDAQVNAANWTGEKKGRKAAITVALKPQSKDPKTNKLKELKLPPTPPEPPPAGALVDGRGPIHVDSTPQGAEVWLYIGVSGEATLEGVQSGLPYEFRVTADGFLPGFTSVSVDDWRDNDPNTPINRAKKKQRLERTVALQPDPAAPKKKGP